MERFYVHGYYYGGNIPFDVIWKSTQKEGNYRLGYNAESGRFTFGMDGEDFYNNVSNGVQELVSNIEKQLNIVLGHDFLHNSLYGENKISVLNQMLSFLKTKFQD